MAAEDLGVRERILALMDAKIQDGAVWIVRDFARLGEQKAVYSALARMVDAGEIERIGASEGPTPKRGLFFRPRTNGLTQRRTKPRPFEVVKAMARRDNLSILVDKGVAANLVGVTPLQPARQVYHTSRAMSAVDVGGIDVEFRMARPSKLYWADRPGMMAYQAMAWARDILTADGEGVDDVRQALVRHLRENPEVATDLGDNVGQDAGVDGGGDRGAPRLYRRNDRTRARMGP